MSYAHTRLLTLHASPAPPSSCGCAALSNWLPNTSNAVPQLRLAASHDAQHARQPGAKCWHPHKHRQNKQLIGRQCLAQNAGDLYQNKASPLQELSATEMPARVGISGHEAAPKPASRPQDQPLNQTAAPVPMSSPACLWPKALARYQYRAS